MKRSTLTEMAAVPARFRTMTREELHACKYPDAQNARHERERRDTIRWGREYIEVGGPAKIAELEADIADVRRAIALEEKRLAKLEAEPPA